MVSFQCDGCGDVVKKPKLNQHRNRCHATFTCIDCSTTFQGQSYSSHNSCMTEAEKFQKHIYQNKGNNKAPSQNKSESKPVSLVAQLKERENKRKADEPKKEEPKKKQKLSEWSSTELAEDETTNIKHAVQYVLKDGKSVKLKDVRKKAIELIEKHPKYKKSDKSDLKKKFEKEFNLTLKDGNITFA
ncbi:hypothetical protein K501DRAFT_239752 [Backusella circina FSU 941]|nr:hypothetical protein K501DRAFT_239752 [Backusella circina FSU 941]